VKAAGTDLSAFYASAKGNVFQTPGLSAFSNRIVNQPTLFAFARGAGLMGEAGPEAIMPLRRGPDGRLGVGAPAGGGGVESITIVNQNTIGDVASMQQVHEQLRNSERRTVAASCAPATTAGLPDGIARHLALHYRREVRALHAADQPARRRCARRGQ
jgi:phage-related minor tail protein